MVTRRVAQVIRTQGQALTTDSKDASGVVTDLVPDGATGIFGVRQVDNMHTASPIIYGPQCQHPKVKDEGTCKNLSIGLYDIPATYKPDRRHMFTEDITRPQAYLCRTHSHKVEAFKRGVVVVGSFHEGQCAICQHPDKDKVEQVVTLWVGWVMSKAEAAIELGVSARIFESHVQWAKLWDRKAHPGALKRALGIAVEKGFAAGGHSVRTAIAAVHELNLMRNVAKTTNVNVQGAIGVGVMDFSKLSPEQLYVLAQQVMEQIKGLPEGEPAEDDLDV